MSEEHSLDLELSPRESLALLEETAESWGGGWEADSSHDDAKRDTKVGGRLAIPVLAGLRHGFVIGRLELEPLPRGTRLSFRPEESVYSLQRPAVVILLLAAFGCFLVVFGLFIPALVPLVPAGALLAIASWLTVVARLRNTGPEEFFTALAAPPEP